MAKSAVRLRVVEEETKSRKVAKPFRKCPRCENPIFCYIGREGVKECTNCGTRY